MTGKILCVLEVFQSAEAEHSPYVFVLTDGMGSAYGCLQKVSYLEAV